MEKKVNLPWNIVAGIGIVTLLILSPLLAYLYYFNKISEDQTAWVNFASYLSGTVSILINIVNLALVLYIAMLARRWQQLDVQRGQAYDSHKEWNSEAMYISRTHAYEFLKKHPVDRLDVLEEKHALDMIHLWIVIGFFQRLYVLHNNDRIADGELIDLFGQIFTWWDIICFDPQLPHEWDSYERIDYLRKMINSQAPTEVYEKWKAYAERDRLAMTPNANTRIDKK